MNEEVIDKTVDPAAEVTDEQVAAEKDSAEKKPDAGKAEFEALQKELKDFKADSERRLADSEASMKFWYDKAEAKATEGAPPKMQKDEPDGDPLDVFDDESRNAVKSFVEQKTAGMISSAEVDKRVVDGVRSQLTQEQLVRDYPELGDKGSEFFKNTTKHYERLDGVQSADRLRMAVEQSELDLRRAGTWKERESDNDRIARIAAQAGGGNGGPSDQAGGDELTNAQNNMAKNMNISPETYVKYAKKVAYATHG